MIQSAVKTAKSVADRVTLQSWDLSCVVRTANRSARLSRQSEGKNRSFSFIGDFSSLTRRCEGNGGNARALVYAVERPLGKEQSRVKLQTRDRGKRATGVEGSTSGRTKKLREIYRDCAGGPSSLKGTEERLAGQAEVSIKKQESFSRVSGAFIL